MFKVSTINIKVKKKKNWINSMNILRIFFFVKLPIIKVEKRGFKHTLSFTEIKRNTETSVGGLMRRAKKIGTNQKSKLINKLKGSRNVDSKGKFQIGLEFFINFLFFLRFFKILFDYYLKFLNIQWSQKTHQMKSMLL